MKKLLIKLNNEIIDQTQGEAPELELWLAGNLHKYPQGSISELYDLEQDYEYLLAKCLEQRKAEYPSPEEYLNASFDGGETAIQALQAKRLEVKAKYPKPIQGEPVAPIISELFPIVIEESAPVEEPVQGEEPAQ